MALPVEYALPSTVGCGGAMICCSVSCSSSSSSRLPCLWRGAFWTSRHLGSENAVGSFHPDGVGRLFETLGNQLALRVEH